MDFVLSEITPGERRTEYCREHCQGEDDGFVHETIFFAVAG
jgi:hypothetical protein